MNDPSKSMKNSLIKIIQKEKFNPSIVGFFINQNFNIRRLLYQKIKKFAPEIKGKILDFGCGSKPYKQLFHNAKDYIGVDYLIEGRSTNFTSIDAYYDGKNIPFKDQFFDGIICTEVLEHVFNLDEVLTELNRVLKPNGKAIITTPFMWEEHEMPYDFARYTIPALEYLYKKHGFEIVKKEKTGNAILVLFQFLMNYFNNILPQNKLIKQVLLLPIIMLFNFFGAFLGTLLPKDQKTYFNSVFILIKKE